MTLFPVTLVVLSTVFHAWWNLVLQREPRGHAFFLRICGIVSLAGAIPATLSLVGHPWPSGAWGLVALSGLFQASYMVGLVQGYRHGAFTVVYPLARALPVLMLAGLDTARGHPPESLGSLGIGLVFLGCILAPLDGGRIRVAHYWNRGMAWVAVVALSTVGYTWVDKLAQEQIRGGLGGAATYGIVQLAAAVPFLWLATRGFREPAPPTETFVLRRAVLAGALLYGAYGLVLWAYQLSDHASYIVSVRQLSIVVGVILGAVVLKEPLTRTRILATLLIVAGTVCIAWTGGG